MTKSFNLGANAEIGSYTGAIIASFFVTQFLTSILWATVADKHGNRAVLVSALTGSAITCALFGTCKSFPEAVAVRLIQGVFNGAVGCVFCWDVVSDRRLNSFTSGSRGAQLPQSLIPPMNQEPTVLWGRVITHRLSAKGFM
jgi:MFS family permease